MEEGGLRRSARKKQLTLKAELNVATEVKVAEWKSWQGKGCRSGREKEKSIAVDSEYDTLPKWKRRRTERSPRSSEEVSDLSEEEDEEEEEEEEGEETRAGTPLLTFKHSPKAEGSRTKSKQPHGRGVLKRRKVNLEHESEDERSNGKEPCCPSVVSGLPPIPAGSNDGGGEDVGMGEGCAEEGREELPMEGCWNHFRDLSEMLPGRRPQIELLLTLFGEVRWHCI